MIINITLVVDSKGCSLLAIIVYQVDGVAHGGNPTAHHQQHQK